VPLAAEDWGRGRAAALARVDADGLGDGASGVRRATGAGIRPWDGAGRVEVDAVVVPPRAKARIPLEAVPPPLDTVEAVQAVLPYCWEARLLIGSRIGSANRSCKLIKSWAN